MVNLGFRASRKDLAAAVGKSQNINDAVSILSISNDYPAQRSQFFESKKEGKKKNKNNQDVSSSQSVMSDVTFHVMPSLAEGTSGTVVASNSPSDFILQCQNGERIFVSGSQGMVIKSRCRSFRVALANRSGACSIVVGGDADSSSKGETYEMDNSIIKKETWSPRTARHVIELLAEGTTWIENKQSRFVELLKACDEINVRFCLGSLINNHDVLDPASSLRFFKLSDSKLYRFKLAGTIRSWQWIQLLQAGILLHLDSKVLMLSLGSPTENGSPVLGQHRLSKCDELYSEFLVYSEKSKMNTFYTIFDLLAANTIKSDTNAPPLAESFQIICKTPVGALDEADLNMLWRMTSASYTLSTASEQKFLSSDDSSTFSSPVPRFALPLGDFQDEEESVAATSTTNSTSSETMDGDPSETRTHSPPSTPSSTSTDNSFPCETRTISGTSFAVLKHLFQAMNPSPPDKNSSHHHRHIDLDSSSLPACLKISNPTPDTLGRFLNACATKRSVDKIGYNIDESTTSVSGKKTTVFYVSGTSRRIREIVEYMADYSKTSVVGNAEYRLEELRKRA